MEIIDSSKENSEAKKNEDDFNIIESGSSKSSDIEVIKSEKKSEFEGKSLSSIKNEEESSTSGRVFKRRGAGLTRAEAARRANIMQAEMLDSGEIRLPSGRV